ncbi:AAA family ATPase [Steroidobacter sp. S1-65]|uniref:AAA family ATPase n=1 Tax=Steroidobacter gossypii TaxID=2805490 RepID=A0ABS1WYD2_9GAMM|nr:AAA family ATPase [Steroidobacter gossypii]MBM0105985.1 AAA family ATPase [Steroidobacter gossypii]
MTRPEVAMYLPISERLLAPVLDEARDLASALAPLDVPQIAALIVLQYLPRLRGEVASSPQQILSNAVRGGHEQVSRTGLQAFVEQIAAQLDRAKVRAGVALLGEFRLALAGDTHAQEGLESIALLSGDRAVLTSEQSRIFKEVRAQTDDHIHVQGYAGTGKSFLIRSLAAMLEPSGARLLVLAERQRQLHALLSGLGQMTHVQASTFERLVTAMTPKGLIDPVNVRMSRTNYHAPTPHDQQVAEYLNIQPTGQFSTHDLVRMVRSTVAAFCFSGEREIDGSHIPAWCASSLDDSTRLMVLHHASQLWQATLLPDSPGFEPPVRGYHRIKWAALNGWKIPSRYTHVIIDECHDLAKPMLQILDASPQAVISVGDEYQNLQGRPQRRANVIRQRAVTSSVRTGTALEQVVNSLILAHPGATKLPFHGNPLARTEIVYYDRPQAPEAPATILVHDTWGLFEWSQRLASENIEVELLSSSERLDVFVSDCIDLYQRGARPRHPELFRFESWQAVSERFEKNRGFQRIDRMLTRGYGAQDWAKVSARRLDPSARRCSLGLISDVRNREFDVVMLTPELVEHAWQSRFDALAAASSSIYVAVTRARRRLIVPERLRQWIEEITTRRNSPRLPFQIA